TADIVVPPSGLRSVRVVRGAPRPGPPAAGARQPGEWGLEVLVVVLVGLGIVEPVRIALAAVLLVPVLVVVLLERVRVRLAPDLGLVLGLVDVVVELVEALFEF